MSGKNPADQFYWQDFYRDLHEQDLEVVGAWILILCKLWYEPERGKGVKTLDEWSKILGKNNKKTLKILSKIQQKNIGNVSPLLEKNIKNMPKDIPIEVISRRMVKREKERESEKLYNKNYYERNKKKDNLKEFSRPIQDSIQDEFPVTSSYLLPSKSIKSSPQLSTNVNNLLITQKQDPTEPEETITPQDDDYAEKIDNLREKLGKVYWKDGRSNVHSWVMWQVKRKVKAKAIFYCLMRVDEERPEQPWAYAEGILKNYHDGELHKKDNLFMDIVEKLKRI